MVGYASGGAWQPWMSGSRDCLGLSAYQWRMLTLGFGLGFAGDGMEMYLLALILPVLPAGWNLNTLSKGLLGGGAFVGMSLGSPFGGTLSDYWGRLPSMRVLLISAFATGALAATAQSMLALLLCRASFGFAIGGFIPAGYTMTAETTPPDKRGRLSALAMCSFSVGAVWVSVLSGPILPTLGWRGLVFFSSLPLLVGAAALFVPGFFVESPLWLRAASKPAEAASAESQIAHINGSSGGGGEGSGGGEGGGGGGEGSGGGKGDQPEAKSSSGGSTSELPSVNTTFVGILRTHCYVSCCLFALWMLVGIGYYGIVFLIPQILNREYRSGKGLPSLPDEAEYLTTTLSAVAEIAGYLITGLASDTWGRRSALAANFGLSAVFAAVCGVLVVDPAIGYAWFMLCACVLKATVSGAFLGVYIITPEVYPTVIRGTALGVCLIFTRAGSAFTPLLAQFLLDYTDGLVSFATFGATMAAASVISALLPFDTLGYHADAPDAARARERLASFWFGRAGSQGGEGAGATESSPLVAPRPV